MPTSNKELLDQTQIELLNKAIEKQNSFKHNFIVGIVRGLGTAIGATIIAGFVIMLLSLIIKSVDDVPILNKIISSDEIMILVNPQM